MINNNELGFDEESHTYTRNSEEYTSVTTFIKGFFPKFDAEAVAEKKAYSYGKYSDKSKEEILEMWDKKAQAGTDTHQIIEDYIKLDQSGETPDIIDDRKAKIGIDYYERLKDRFHIIEIEPELQVFHDKYKLAGTIDLAFKHPNKAGGAKWQTTLIDWKTNNGIYKSPYDDGDTGTHELTEDVPDANWHHYSLQLSLYAHILEDQFGHNIYKLKLAHLQQDEVNEHDIPYRKDRVKKLCQTKQQSS